MSAYILGEDGFRKLALELFGRSSLATNLCDENYYFNQALLRFLKNTLDTPIPNTEQNLPKVVTMLYEANVSAVKQRYDSEYKIQNLFKNFEMVYQKPEWSLTQLYKHLQCLLYQMTEGDVYKSHLYNCLDEFIKEIADIIISTSSEYDNLHWSW